VNSEINFPFMLSHFELIEMWLLLGSIIVIIVYTQSHFPKVKGKFNLILSHPTGFLTDTLYLVRE